MEREITVTIKLTDKIIAQLMGIDGDISEQWEGGDREITTTPGGLGLQ